MELQLFLPCVTIFDKQWQLDVLERITSPAPDEVWQWLPTLDHREKHCTYDTIPTTLWSTGNGERGMMGDRAAFKVSGNAETLRQRSGLGVRCEQRSWRDLGHGRHSGFRKDEVVHATGCNDRSLKGNVQSCTTEVGNFRHLGQNQVCVTLFKTYNTVTVGHYMKCSQIKAFKVINVAIVFDSRRHEICISDAWFDLFCKFCGKCLKFRSTSSCFE